MIEDLKKIMEHIGDLPEQAQERWAQIASETYSLRRSQGNSRQDSEQDAVRAADKAVALVDGKNYGEDKGFSFFGEEMVDTMQDFLDSVEYQGRIADWQDVDATSYDPDDEEAITEEK